MRAFSSGDLSGQNPSWYWTNGLHDALILSVEQKDIPYDYTQRNPIRNCLKIRLDASDALYDTHITCINLFNYKILTDESSKGGYEEGGITGCYWMQDNLSYENGKYILEITALAEDDFRYVIRFDHAQVERN